MIRRYDVLVENLMDPCHGTYAHKGLMGKFNEKEDPGRYAPCPCMIGRRCCPIYFTVSVLIQFFFFFSPQLSSTSKAAGR